MNRLFARPPQWLRDPVRSGSSDAPRTILLTGATGFIGGHLCRRLIGRGDRLLVLARNRERASNLYGPHVQIVTSLGELPDAQRIDAIVNLAGAPIAARLWTAQRRRELLDSRIGTTRELVALIARLQRKPAVLISMSAIGYYGVRGDEELTEADRGQPIFQSNLCQNWELAAQAAERYCVRVCRLRTGVVLGADGGALPQLARPARMHLRVVLASGRQWMSWIHLDDLLRLIEFCIERDDMHGAVNATAPQPVRQAGFARALASRFGRALPLAVPERVLRVVLGEMAQLFADGQRVIPLRATGAGFEFRYASIETAFEHLFASQPAFEPEQVLYDPDCPVCEAEKTRYCRSARRAQRGWRFDDVAMCTELQTCYRIDIDDARKRVYVFDKNDRVLSGMAAITSIWAALPGWRWLARIVNAPGIRQLADGLYDLAIAPIVWHWSQRRRRMGTAPSVNRAKQARADRF